MRIFLTLILAILLLPTLAAEEIIENFKDRVLTTEKMKGASRHKAFYIFKPEKYRGKKVVFRMNMKRTAGNAPLNVMFRCTTNPGNVLRVTKQYPNPYRKTGEKVPVEFILDIPDLDNPRSMNEARIYDRILAKCHPIEVKGASRRRKEVIADYERTKKILGL